MASFAERQLLKFGWEKGKGLGKNKDGISKAITVDIKKDNAGIGSKDVKDYNSFAWWDHAFNKAVSNIKVVKDDDSQEISVSREEELKRSDIVNANLPVKKKKKKTSKEDDSLISGFIGHSHEETVEETVEMLSTSKMSDKELFNLCGGRTAHKGARSSMNGKLKRAFDIGLGLPDIKVEEQEENEEEEEIEKKKKKNKKRRKEEKKRKREEKKESK